MKPDEYRRLVSAGLTPDQVAVVMEMLDARDEDRKAQQRARWRKHQQNKKNANVSQRELTIANVPRERDTRVEDKPLTQKIEPQEKVKNTRSADADAFKSELSDLDPERMKALIEHRRRKRAAITAKAARMFRDDADKCGLSLADAVDTCIRRNWIAIEPDWLGKPNARGSPPKGNSVAEAARRLKGELENARELQSRDGSGPVRQALPNLSLVSGRGW